MTEEETLKQMILEAYIKVDMAQENFTAMELKQSVEDQELQKIRAAERHLYVTRYKDADERLQQLMRTLQYVAQGHPLLQANLLAKGDTYEQNMPRSTHHYWSQNTRLMDGKDTKHLNHRKRMRERRLDKVSLRDLNRGDIIE